jgi:hypothetical protein
MVVDRIKQDICEGSFCFMIGQSKTLKPSDSSTQWKAFKAIFQKKDPTQVMKEEIITSRGKSVPFQDAESWLREAVAESDCIVTKEGANDDGTSKNCKVLCHCTISGARDTYWFERELQGAPESRVAKKSCFQKAFRYLENGGSGPGDITIKLLGNRGTFPTCSICNETNEVLRDKSRVCHNANYYRILLL